MEYKISENKISYIVDNAELAAASFMSVPGKTNVINLYKVMVDESLRGQGIAGQLVQKVAEKCRAEGLQIKPTCSYAVSWFKKHPEYVDLLDEPLE